MKTKTQIPDKIIILTHYPKYDKDCLGDYECVEVLFDKKVIRSYGDYYHDKGNIRAKEFIDGYIIGVGNFITKDITVEEKRKADYVG